MSTFIGTHYLCLLLYLSSTHINRSHIHTNFTSSSVTSQGSFFPPPYIYEFLSNSEKYSSYYPQYVHSFSQLIYLFIQCNQSPNHISQFCACSPITGIPAPPHVEKEKGRQRKGRNGGREKGRKEGKGSDGKRGNEEKIGKKRKESEADTYF